MKSATKITFSVLILIFLLTGCAQPPSQPEPDQEKHLVAKRFVHNFSGGKLAMIGLQRKIEEEAPNNPGMAELLRRAFAETTEEDLDESIANVYSRHLSQDTLTELIRFSESPTGKRFFRLVYQNATSGAPNGKESFKKNVTRAFNADELTEILKFSQSEAAKSLHRALPAINRELNEEGRKLGETVIRDYINKQ